MNQIDRIGNAFSQASAQKRALFVTYLCAGDPDYTTSLEACRAAIDAGTDILELGVPFSDPLADGLTNQLAAQRALEAGMTHQQALDLVRAIRQFSDIPIVFYTYYNMVFAHGDAAYAAMIAEAGVDGVLTLDLPPEESGEFCQACEQHGLKTVFIIAPTTPAERMRQIEAVTTGFIYYVSRTGVTGEQETMAANLAAQLASIRACTELPVVVGFGISRPEHVRIVAEVADGVVVGSSIVNCIAKNLEDRPAAVAAISKRIRELRQGLLC